MGLWPKGLLKIVSSDKMRERVMPRAKTDLLYYCDTEFDVINYDLLLLKKMVHSKCYNHQFIYVALMFCKHGEKFLYIVILC